MRLLPPAGTAAKLFVVGSTVGPVVDSLHNQCLLEYDLVPISLAWPEFVPIQQLHPAASNFLFCSSWAVPPLLGVAYVVLGGILPRIFQSLLDGMRENLFKNNNAATAPPKEMSMLGTRAVVAVATTALIIKLSEFLETHPPSDDGLLLFSSLPTSDANLILMLAAALLQWRWLDGTWAALLAASLTSVGGPLSELPFVAHGFWHYLPQAADYVPLEHVNLDVLSWLLGENYHDLALSTITGPCYFAVTMDAIALGRWFDSMTTTNNES